MSRVTQPVGLFSHPGPVAHRLHVYKKGETTYLYKQTTVCLRIPPTDFRYLRRRKCHHHDCRGSDIRIHLRSTHSIRATLHRATKRDGRWVGGWTSGCRTRSAGEERARVRGTRQRSRRFGPGAPDAHLSPFSSSTLPCLLSACPACNFVSSNGVNRQVTRGTVSTSCITVDSRVDLGGW